VKRKRLVLEFISLRGSSDSSIRRVLDHRSVVVDDLVVGPLAREETFEISVGNLFSVAAGGVSFAFVDQDLDLNEREGRRTSQRG